MIGEETVKETDEKHLEFFMIMMFVLILSYIMLVEWILQFTHFFKLMGSSNKPFQPLLRNWRQ